MFPGYHITNCTFFFNVEEMSTSSFTSRVAKKTFKFGLKHDIFCTFKINELKIIFGYKHDLFYLLQVFNDIRQIVKFQSLKKQKRGHIILSFPL